MTQNRPAPRDWREPATGSAEETHPVRTLQARMNDLLEEMWEKIGKHHTAVSGRAYSGPPPHADLSKGGKDWRLEIETPGIEEKDLEVILGDGEITVQGEKKVEREESGRDYYLSERRVGRFSRSFALPGDADAERIKADYRDGVLTITIPKKAGAKSGTKKIPIQGK